MGFTVLVIFYLFIIQLINNCFWELEIERNNFDYIKTIRSIWAVET